MISSVEQVLKRNAPESPKHRGMDAVFAEMRNHKLRKVIRYGVGVLQLKPNVVEEKCLNLGMHRSPGGTAERSKLKRPMHPEDFFGKIFFLFIHKLSLFFFYIFC